MRPSEAAYIAEILGDLPNDVVGPCLNVGSSTKYFREVEQPHVDRLIFKPLAKRGIQVTHADLKPAEGVDIAGSIYDPLVLERIKARAPRLVMCCNMFEHVEDRETLAAALAAVVPADGRLVVTAPHSYPIHYDPIDSYYRPSPDELAHLFPGFELESSKIIQDSTYGEDLLRELGPVGMCTHFAKSGAKLFMFWRGRERWLAHFHRYLWLWRRYSVSCIVLRKPA